MGNPLPILRERAVARGCWIDDHGRLCFPRALVEDVIATTPGKFVVPPPKAEEMYHPETFGRGSGDVVIVE